MSSDIEWEEGMLKEEWINNVWDWEQSGRENGEFR